jgi:hypothetical protein
MKSFRRALMLLPVLPLLASLPACVSNKPLAVVKTPPADKLICKTEPAPPTVATDGTVASYIVDLADAGQSCRSQLAWIKMWAKGLAGK